MPILGGCLCFDLPTGSKIIGAVYLFFAIVNTLMLAIINVMLFAMGMLTQILSLLDSSATEASKNTFPINPAFANNDTSQADFRESIDMIKRHTFAMKVIFLTLLCIAFLSIITSSLLVHGIRKNRRGLLTPWMIQEVLHLVISIAFVVLVFVLFGAAKVAWTLTLPIMLAAFIQVFFIVVVLSQFQALGLIRMHDELCMNVK